MMTARHNALLRLLYNYLVAHLPDEWVVWVDLPDLPGSYHRLPEEWTAMAQRPDLVLWCLLTGEVVLIELTVPAEVGMAAARLRKEVRYQALTAEIDGRPGLTCHLVTVEVSAGGWLPKDQLKPFFNLCENAKERDAKELRLALSKEALEQTEGIFRRRDA